MAAIAIPSAKAVAPKAKPRKGKRRAKKEATSAGVGSKIKGLWARLTNQQARKQYTTVAKSAGTILGTGVLLSAISGYRESSDQRVGEGLIIHPKYAPVDLRVVLGLGGLVAGQAARGKTSWSPRFTEVGVGSLASWLFDQAYERGAKWAGTPLTFAPAAPASNGIVVGRISEHRREHLLEKEHDIESKERKLAERLDKLKSKLAKHGGGHHGGGHHGGGAKTSPSGGKQLADTRPPPHKAPHKHVFVNHVPLSHILPQFRHAHKA